MHSVFLPLALLNISGTIPGPLNAQFYIPFYAPNTSAVGAGGQGVFVSPLLDASLTLASAPQPVNLTAAGKPNPWDTDPGFNYANGTEVIAPPSPTSTTPSTGAKNAAWGRGVGWRERMGVVGGVVVGALVLL